MIISPNELITINVLHAVNNSYKCTDQVAMFSQSEDDCNLYLKRLYWERDPNDEYVPPDFSLPRVSVMLIREDLAGASLADTPTSSGNTVYVPFLLYNRDGYATGDELIDFYLSSDTTYQPLLLPLSSDTAATQALQQFRLTQSYFPPHQLRLQYLNGSYYSSITTEHLQDFNILTAIAGRLRFGEERRVCAVLFYRPRGDGTTPAGSV